MSELKDEDTVRVSVRPALWSTASGRAAVKLAVDILGHQKMNPSAPDESA